MEHRSMTGRVAQMATRRPWTFVIAWVVLLSIAGFVATRFGEVIDDDGGLTVATESGHADEVLRAAFPPTEAAGEVLIIESADRTAHDPTFEAEVGDVASGLRNLAVVESVISPYDGVPGLISADGHVVLLSLELVPETDSVEPVAVVQEHLGGRTDAGFRTTLMGSRTIGAEMDRLADDTLIRGESIGLAIALLVLFVVFGSLRAAGIPLLLAIAAIVVAVALTTIVGQWVGFSSVVMNMITMIGLAVGVDYALFVVHRFREERRDGRNVPESVVVAAATAGRAVVFSGLTVMVALTGLLLIPEQSIRSVGIGAILAVVGALLAASTLLPAVLTLMGGRLRSGHPFRKNGSGGRAWERIAAVVMRRPAVSAGLAAITLVVLALPYAAVSLGSNFVYSLPDDSDVVHGFDVLSERFDAGASISSVVVDSAGPVEGDLGERLDRLAAMAEASPHYGHTEVVTSETADVAVVELSDLEDPSTTEGRAALNWLRSEAIPEVFAGSGATVSVTGDAASTADFVAVIGDRTPLVFVSVLAVSFVLLAMVFRSIFVPLKAIVMNLLSVGAAYGTLVLVFQWGVGADLFGFQTSDVIESWIPLFLFTVLFGLSMDYHIFLSSRIKEHHDRSGVDNLASVSFGLRSTGALITGAALIMVAVFGGFASGDLAVLQQLGFGLAVAVVLDVTIVRSVLVPATMALLGERNWYLPSWLGWLPRIEIDGTPTPALATAVGVGR